MAEQKIQTSAGMETASETVARAKAQLAASQSSTTPPTGVPTPGTPVNPVLEALTERLTQQGKGISSSSSSDLQTAINEAIAGKQKAGDLTTERLQSERTREMAYAKDRASTGFTSAQEGQTGYAMQTAAFRELTDTTEKSIRDLDKRYQESMMANDSLTASGIADLRMKKLEFQQTQEENYFRNILQVADMTQKEDLFYKQQLNENQRFAATMQQSNYQFEKNLGVQYKQLDLQGQELEISRERNQISWAEYGLKKQALNEQKAQTVVAGKVFGDLRNEVMTKGTKSEDLDPAGYALWAMENNKIEGATYEQYLSAAQYAKSDMVTNKFAAPTPASAPYLTGPMAPGGWMSNLSAGLSSTGTELRQQILGLKQGETPNNWMNN